MRRRGIEVHNQTRVLKLRPDTLLRSYVYRTRHSKVSAPVLHGFENNHGLSDIVYETDWNAMRLLAEHLPYFDRHVAGFEAMAQPSSSHANTLQAADLTHGQHMSGYQYRIAVAEAAFARYAHEAGIRTATGGPVPIKVRHHVEDEGNDLVARGNTLCGLHVCCASEK